MGKNNPVLDTKRKHRLDPLMLAKAIWDLLNGIKPADAIAAPTPDSRVAQDPPKPDPPDLTVYGAKDNDWPWV